MSTKGTAYHPGLKTYKIECKCPACGRKHTVSMPSKPAIMPRVFCKIHEHRRYTYAYCG